ncbi:hypothetical protein ACFZCP_05985 [Streptomyces sp. NPDC007971]|uniref:hypothetical protein n=1 Tax=Streptomyces sp. NPDC007971 TaxID=3364799 RepID=UPI0036EA6038
MNAETLATQAAVLTCLAGLAVGHPNLPGAYLTISRYTPGEVAVQLESPAAVEAWREALGVDPDKVVADRIGTQPSLEFDATAYGIDFHVYATYQPAPTEAGAA